MIRFLQTPGPVKKIVLGGLLVAICVIMVISLTPTLSNSFLGGVPQGVVAKVGNQEITSDEVMQGARRMLQQQEQQSGGRNANLSGLLPYFVQQSAQQLVTQKVLMLAASQLGLQVTDQEVAAWLQHGPFSPYLFPKGQFIGTDSYEEFTERQFNMTVPQFEQAIKSELLSDKLRNVVEAGVTVSDQDVRTEYRKQNLKVKFDYAVLSADDMKKEVHATDAELKTFYTQHQSNYANAIPEKRQISYIVIDPESVKNRIHVTPAELRQYYDSHADEFRVAEEVKVRHILIKIPAPGADGKVDPKALEAARAKAQDLLSKLKAGGNFADLAGKFSEDPGSAQAGGELGWLGRGRAGDEFDNAAFSLPAGQMSSVIQSPVGFQIIQVEDKHPARLKSLDEVKGEVETAVVEADAAAKTENVANAVQAEARATNLSGAAARNGLQLLTSPFLERTDTIPGIGPADEFMNAAFSAPLNNPPELAHLPQGLAVFQVAAIHPPATPSFDEIKARVENDFDKDQAQQMFTKKLAQLVDRARALHDLKKAAAEVGAKFETSDLVSSSSQVPDLGALTGSPAAIFDLKVGDISSPISTGPSRSVVVSLLEKQEPAPEDYAKQKDQVRDTLLGKKRTDAMNQFQEDLQQRLQKEGKIRINKEELERLAPKQTAG
jgi:peptidyl-prolyl cis-trans isomerase D